MEKERYAHGAGHSRSLRGTLGACLLATLDPGYYEEEWQLGKIPITSLDTLRVSSDEEVR